MSSFSWSLGMEYLKFPLAPSPLSWIWLLSFHSPVQLTIKSSLFQAKIRPSTDGVLTVYDDIFHVLINVNDPNAEFHSISLPEAENVEMFKVYYEMSTELGTLVPLTDNNNKTVRMKCEVLKDPEPVLVLFCHRSRSKTSGVYCLGLTICLPVYKYVFSPKVKPFL